MIDTNIFIDTNVFVYSIGKDHPLRTPCTAVIQKIRDGKISAIINTKIIQEILYRFQSIKKLKLGINLSKHAISLSSQILPVTFKDLSLALEILETYPSIQTRDAFHAATMINNSVKEIISTDPHFDLIPEIQRTDPLNIQ